MRKKITQDEQVKRHLLSGWSITPIHALNSYGIFRLAAVVHRLRTQEGMNIKTIPTTDRRTGKTYATYKLDAVINIDGGEQVGLFDTK